MRFAVVLSLSLLLLPISSVASAEPLDVKAVAKQAEACAPEALAPLGALQRAETIGKRSKTELVHVIGKQARGYLVFAHDACYVVPVVGKPLAFAKGKFGGGATEAFALSAVGCGDLCVQVVSLKKGEQLLDVLRVPENCEDGIKLARRALFADRDSLELGCFSSAGADRGRADLIVDTKSGELRTLVSSRSGIAWVQVDDTSPVRCTARVPGGIKIAATGAKPALDVAVPATPEQAEAAKLDWTSGGCEAIVATTRMTYDGAAFVAKGKPRISKLSKLCACRKP